MVLAYGELWTKGGGKGCRWSKAAPKIRFNMAEDSLSSSRKLQDLLRKLPVEVVAAV